MVLISRTVELVANSSSWALTVGSLCKSTHTKRLWELRLSCALQILDFDWLIDWFWWWILLCYYTIIAVIFRFVGHCIMGKSAEKRQGIVSEFHSGWRVSGHSENEITPLWPRNALCLRTRYLTPVTECVKNHWLRFHSFDVFLMSCVQLKWLLSASVIAVITVWECVVCWVFTSYHCYWCFN